MTKQDFMALFRKSKTDTKNWDAEMVKLNKLDYDFYLMQYQVRENGTWLGIELRFDVSDFNTQLDKDVYGYYGFKQDAQFELYSFVEDNEEKIDEHLTKEETKEIVKFLNDEMLYPNSYYVREVLRRYYGEEK